jgi:hypothetical protein
MRYQLELAKIQQTVERRLREKEEEFENSRKTSQRLNELLQVRSSFIQTQKCFLIKGFFIIKISCRHLLMLKSKEKLINLERRRSKTLISRN